MEFVRPCLPFCVLLAITAALPARAVVQGVAAPELKTHSVMVLDDHGRMCTGVVLTQNAVLTAAHCVTNAGAWRVHWRAPDATPVMVEPKAIHIHPGYDPRAVQTRSKSIDLAIVTLADPLPDPFQPLPLSDITNVQPGDIIQVAGFGETDEANRKSVGTMMRAELQVVEPHGHSTILVWLSDPTEKGSGGCHGDSGGPLIANGALIAITSWTKGNGKHDCGLITQGILIGPHKAWIDKILGQN